ncbi:hypothetical protein ABB37_04027 [Leptomonas pyrrhocoris]|uniref:Uncharacterized protein n=1 Tax=Leptomonas pyrrhocoris TaxID=157538 RepID=A0A0N0DWF2_LEPPY|nr:hypothetical protein ABB37_04027 [Leptomonas pyrrhocoris]KPA81734.1 hypothetical protein ABB37_04027 [Leptomonas pyrrhocoris]|eukprot:XP_015660173.1 hypothetical protein ABB37_04027 [Leptomonas pyrrhocoris]
MPQVVAWKCFQAQTELAHLTNTLPPYDNYEHLMSVIEPKLIGTRIPAPNINDSLRKRSVCLSTDGGSPVEPTPNVFNLNAGAPVVVFLCDIEGTTTPLPFVRNVMMPLAEGHYDTYAKAHFPSDVVFVQHVEAAAVFISAKRVNPPVTDSADALAELTLSEAFSKSKAAGFADEDANSAVRELFGRHFKEETEKGSKETHVKAVQAAILEEVYAQGEHQTQVLPDVNEFFRCIGCEAQRGGSRHIALYSSGSVAAQKLIMRHTPYGDLNPFITAYFDPTDVGTKLTPKSYMRIRNLLAKQLDVGSPDNLQIVFVTDSTSEASAADTSRAVDCSVLCLRPLNEWISIETLLSVSVPFITSFTQLLRPGEKVDYNQLVKDTLAALEDKTA